MHRLRVRSLSLTWKFVVVFLLLVTVPTTLFGVVVVRQTSAILNEEAISSTERLMDTIERNILSMVKDAEDISTYSIFSDDIRKLLISGASDGPEQLRVKEQVTGFYTFHFFSKPYIRSISLYDNDDRLLLEIGEPLRGEEAAWSANAKEAGGAIVWTDSYKMNGREGSAGVITLVRQIYDINNLSQPLGQIRIRLFEERLYESISSGVGMDAGTIFLVRPDGAVIAHREKGLLGGRYPDRAFVERAALHRDQGEFEHLESGQSYLAMAKSVDDMDWLLVVMLDKEKIVRETEQVKRTYSIMIAAMLLMGMAALLGFYFTLIRPILQLIVETRKVERGDFTAHVKVLTADEIGVLGKRFNRMVATIEWLIDSKYKLEIKQKESELKALQAQISPHFLYNTLDTIRWTARLEKAMNTSRLIETLSRFLRLGLSGGKLWVPLAEELLYTRSYLELQRERMGDELQFSMYVDAGAENAVVQKQLLQPLVENSILHGFGNVVGSKRIAIRCYAESGDLLIDVIDNGVGLPSEMNEDAIGYILQQNNKGFAMKNIHERLRLAFGEPYGLQAVPQDGRGARLRICMPLLHTAPAADAATAGGEAT